MAAGTDASAYPASPWAAKNFGYFRIVIFQDRVGEKTAVPIRPAVGSGGQETQRQPGFGTSSHGMARGRGKSGKTAFSLNCPEISHLGKLLLSAWFTQ